MSCFGKSPTLKTGFAVRTLISCWHVWRFEASEWKERGLVSKSSRCFWVSTLDIVPLGLDCLVVKCVSTIHTYVTNLVQIELSRREEGAERRERREGKGLRMQSALPDYQQQSMDVSATHLCECIAWEGFQKVSLRSSTPYTIDTRNREGWPNVKPVTSTLFLPLSFIYDLLSFQYSFDSDQTSSTDGPASAALKASRDRKRSRSSSKSPSPRVETHRQTSQIQIDSDSDEVPLSRSPTPPSRSFLPDPNAYRSSASSKSSTSKASLNTPLSVDNLGFAMLMKMGWSGRNQGLGKDGKGRLEPIEMKESGGSEGRGLGEYCWGESKQVLNSC